MSAGPDLRPDGRLRLAPGVPRDVAGLVAAAEAVEQLGLDGEERPAGADGLDEIGPRLLEERPGLGAAGDAFDPERHHAMTVQEGTGAEAGTVTQVFQKGYVLNQRLVRPAMVVVAR